MENPASFKEEEEWPDNVAVFRTDRTTEVLSSGGAHEALYVAVESMSLAEAGSQRGVPESATKRRRIISMKVCLSCELMWREKVARKRPDFEEWATKECVMLDHKKPPRGVIGWSADVTTRRLQS